MGIQKQKAERRAAILWQMAEGGTPLTAATIAEALNTRTGQVSYLYTSFQIHGIAAPSYEKSGARTKAQLKQAAMDAMPRQHVDDGGGGLQASKVWSAPDQPGSKPFIALLR